MAEKRKQDKLTDKKKFNIAFFSSKNWVVDSFNEINKKFLYDLTFLEPRLNAQTASLAKGHDAVCAFVNDQLDAEAIEQLKENKVKLIALRCAGFNNVDIEAAHKNGIKVVRVPAYSPYAVAEHTLGLILSSNRKFHKAYTRVRDGNFALEGMLGFDLHGKTVGIIGTGKIGQVLAEIMLGLGCNILAHDKFPDEDLKKKGVKYVELPDLYEQSDIITLHCPLTHETYHIINEYSISAMKKGVMIINTSRGPLIDTAAAIEGLKKGKIGHLGIDVYEEEEDLFFEDYSERVIPDDMFARLLTFPNVLITSHQAFFTREAVHNIAETTLDNVKAFFEKGETKNEVKPKKNS
jgi:D-lactate dehydrogenase